MVGAQHLVGAEVGVHGVHGQPVIHNEFQHGQGFTRRPKKEKAKGTGLWADGLAGDLLCRQEDLSSVSRTPRKMTGTDQYHPPPLPIGGTHLIPALGRQTQQGFWWIAGWTVWPNW